MIESLSNLVNPVVVMAFGGWNDAADAATEVIDFFETNYPTDEVWNLDSEDYYDYQVNRPRICFTEDGRDVEWPVTSICVSHLPERDVVLVAGPEPNLRWRSFATTLISAFRSIEPELVVTVGAMLADKPHTHPVHVSATSSDPDLAAKLGLPTSSYEGTTGIVGVLSDSCRRAGLPVVSLWAHVPHYVSNPPNPKATLALLEKVADLLDLEFDLGELEKLAASWERSVNEVVAEDPDIADYVASLEASVEQTFSADSIAAEFERYLRQRDR